MEPKKDVSHFRHKATVDLFYSEQRQQREERLSLVFQTGLKKVGSELHFELNQDQIYNLMGVYEGMKRNKGVVIVGPICTGKTMLIKLMTLALKKIFHTTLRTSYVSP